MDPPTDLQDMARVSLAVMKSVIPLSKVFSPLCVNMVQYTYAQKGISLVDITVCFQTCLPFWTNRPVDTIHRSLLSPDIPLLGLHIAHSSCVLEQSDKERDQHLTLLPMSGLKDTLFVFFEKPH